MKRREVYEHNLSATGRDIQIDHEDPEEGVWIERRTKRGYEPIMKAKILHSDPGRVEFMYNGDLPPRKYQIAVHTRCGRGKDHKVRWLSAATKFLHNL